MLKRAALLAVAGILTLGSSLPVLAAEEEIIEPAGYHVYDSTEDSETDTWYGIARGTYLKSGDSSITKKDSTHALCTGNTLAHIKADKVYVRVYLDKSDTGKSGTWGTVNYWTGTATECVHGSCIQWFLHGNQEQILPGDWCPFCDRKRYNGIN